MGDMHTLKIEDHQAIPWEHFRDAIEASWEMNFGVIEQRRDEECIVAPEPGSDVIVAEILGVSTDTLISTMKMAGKED
jgi:hypothetical protein